MKQKKLLIVTALLAALALLFLILWCASAAKLKALRNDSAEAVAQAVNAYVHDPTEERYRNCIGQMRTFLSAWEKTGGKGEGYEAGCKLYAVMCVDPRGIYEYAEDIIPVMESLSRNIRDREALQELARISRILSDT